MRNKIIAVDFDGTLCENKYPEIGVPRTEVINALIKEQQAGARVILWTCRSGEDLLAAIYWALDKGIAFDAVNENLKSSVEYFGNDSRKIWADEYWDDKAALPFENKAEREKAKKLIKKLLISITSHRDFLNMRISSVGVYDRRRAQGLSHAVEELESAIKFIEDYAAKNYGLTASECNIL